MAVEGRLSLIFGCLFKTLYYLVWIEHHLIQNTQENDLDGIPQIQVQCRVNNLLIFSRRTILDAFSVQKQPVEEDETREWRNDEIESQHAIVLGQERPLFG